MSVHLLVAATDDALSLFIRALVGHEQADAASGHKFLKSALPHRVQRLSRVRTVKAPLDHLFPQRLPQ